MNNLKRARLKAGLSQKEVAYAVGVSVPTVSEWESGKKNPNSENSKKLAALFDESLDYLFNLETSNRTISNTLFCERLKHLRHQSGLSQEAFAREVKTSQSSVAHWESGLREPNIEMLLRIADYFGVTLDYLFGRVEFPDEHFIAKEKLPAELADSGFGDVTKVGSPALTEQEIEVLKRLAAQFGQQD